MERLERFYSHRVPAPEADLAMVLPLDFLVAVSPLLALFLLCVLED